MKPTFHIRQEQVQLSAERPVRVEKVFVNQPVAAHDHEFHEISLFTAGRVTHVTPTARTPLTGGGAVVIPPGGVHAFERCSDARAINVYFLPEWLNADLNLLWDEPGMVPLFCSGSLVQTDLTAKQMTLSDQEVAAAVHELDQLIDELSRPTSGQAFMKSCFLKTLAILSRSWCRSDPAWKETTFSPAVRLTLNAIERSIDAGEPFHVAATAAEAGLSPDRLAAVFRQSLGLPPLEFYQRRRVHRACQLLADVRRSITDVAMTLGYADAPHFSRFFKEHRGLTPRDYRRTFVRPIPTDRD